MNLEKVKDENVLVNQVEVKTEETSVEIEGSPVKRSPEAIESIQKMDKAIEDFDALNNEKSAEKIKNNSEIKEKVKTIFEYAVAAGFMTAFVAAPILVGLDSKIIHDIIKALSEGETMLAGTGVILGTAISTAVATYDSK